MDRRQFIKTAGSAAVGLGVPKFPRDLWRIRGGNQRLPLAIADALGDRLQFGCVAKKIAQGGTGVTVSCTGPSGSRQIDADVAVLSIPLPMIMGIEADPPWTSERRHLFAGTRYFTGTRLVFQTRTRVWEDGFGPNLVFGHPNLFETWSMATR